MKYGPRAALETFRVVLAGKSAVPLKIRVLAILVGSIGFTLVFGAVPALRFLWSLCIVTVVLTAVYVALLAYFARLERAATEQSRKVVPIARAAVFGDPYGHASPQHAGVQLKMLLGHPKAMAPDNGISRLRQILFP